MLANDAEGIGLFRSEFLYLEREDWPTEEFQFDAYGQVAQEMGDRPVIIRTLDIGADKQVDYFNLSHEDNPALGYRAIRISPDPPGDFQSPVTRIIARLSIRQHRHYAAHDHLCAGGTRRQADS